jgi:hypothetical protein
LTILSLRLYRVKPPIFSWPDGGYEGKHILSVGSSPCQIFISSCSSEGMFGHLTNTIGYLSDDYYKKKNNKI